jgi:hypothetical protein
MNLLNMQSLCFHAASQRGEVRVSAVAVIACEIYGVGFADSSPVGLSPAQTRRIMHRRRRIGERFIFSARRGYNGLSAFTVTTINTF